LSEEFDELFELELDEEFELELELEFELEFDDELDELFELELDDEFDELFEFDPRPPRPLLSSLSSSSFQPPRVALFELEFDEEFELELDEPPDREPRPSRPLSSSSPDTRSTTAPKSRAMSPSASPSDMAPAGAAAPSMAAVAKPMTMLRFFMLGLLRVCHRVDMPKERLPAGVYSSRAGKNEIGKRWAPRGAGRPLRRPALLIAPSALAIRMANLGLRTL
jgi:hypothetical protein